MISTVVSRVTESSMTDEYVPIAPDMAPLPTTLTSMRSDTSTTITVAYAALESSLNPTV